MVVLAVLQRVFAPVAIQVVPVVLAALGVSKITVQLDTVQLDAVEPVSVDQEAGNPD